MRVPDGFSPVNGVGAMGFARANVADAVTSTLARWGSLARAGARHPDAMTLRGRGPVYAVPAPEGGRWVIRRYRRGGWMAPLLGERYLWGRLARPVRETLASEAALARGIPTPRVVAGVVYPGGIFYRADLVTEWIEGTTDLASLLFEGPRDQDREQVLLTRTGQMIARLAAAGIHHRDLNARNLLARTDAADGADLVVLDLDRASVHAPGSLSPGPMGARLMRSLRKLERSTQRSLARTGWAALRESLDGSPGVR